MHDVIRDALYFIEGVRDIDRGNARIAQAFKVGKNLSFAGVVERRERFVKQQKIWAQQ